MIFLRTKNLRAPGSGVVIPGGNVTFGVDVMSFGGLSITFA